MQMPISYLKASFRGQISERDLPQLYQAVHGMLLPSPAQAYPLVQCKRLGKIPVLIALAEGADVLRALLDKHPKGLVIKRQELPFERIYHAPYTLKRLESPYPYHLRNWAPFEDHRLLEAFRNTSGEQACRLLDGPLREHLEAFASGLGFEAAQAWLRCQVDEVVYQRRPPLPNVPGPAIDVTFSTNLSIPDYAGLGPSADKGLGIAVRRSLWKN
jgi:hypothetical protein